MYIQVKMFGKKRAKQCTSCVCVSVSVCVYEWRV